MAALFGVEKYAIKLQTAHCWFEMRLFDASGATNKYWLGLSSLGLSHRHTVGGC